MAAAAVVSDPLPPAAAPGAGVADIRPSRAAGQVRALPPSSPSPFPLSLPPFALLPAFLPRCSSSRRRRGHAWMWSPAPE